MSCPVADSYVILYGQKTYFSFFNHFYSYAIIVILILPPLASSTHLIPPQAVPTCCPCPWVIHTCSLSSPLPFFPTLSAPPLVTVSLLHVSVPLVLCCSSLDSSYRWDHMVFVFHRLGTPTFCDSMDGTREYYATEVRKHTFCYFYF